MLATHSLCRAGFRWSALALSITTASYATAQTQPEIVNVIGQGAQLQQALEEQRRERGSCRCDRPATRR